MLFCHLSFLNIAAYDEVSGVGMVLCSKSSKKPPWVAEIAILGSSMMAGV